MSCCWGNHLDIIEKIQTTNLTWNVEQQEYQLQDRFLDKVIDGNPRENPAIAASSIPKLQSAILVIELFNDD